MSIENEVKSWLTSKTILGAVIAGVASVASVVFKVEFPVGFATEVGTSLAGVFGALLAVYGRIKAVKKIK